MKLHRLAVRNFKGIVEREVDFPASGVLVIEGPNEVGKSSMLEALDLLLDHKDSSRRAEIRAAQPVGQDVAPSVEVEMSTGPYRFTYRKQWRKQPRTELEITSPRRMHLTGDEAHERAGAMLAETTDLHLWRALRLLQATPLLPADLSNSSALASALDAAAGSAHDAGAAGESLLAAAEAVHLRYFTAKHAQPTGEYRIAIERLARAEEGVTRAQEALDEVAADVVLHDRLVREGAGCDEQLAASRRAHAELERQWAEIEGLGEAVAAATRARDEARRDLQRYEERAVERRELAAGAAARETALVDQEEALAELRAGLDPLEARLAELLVAAEAAAAAQEAARGELDAATTQADLARDAAELSAVSARIERIDAAARARAQADAALDGLAVTHRVWDEIEAAARAVELAAAARSAGSASVRLRSLAPGQVVRVGDDEVTVEPGDERVVTLDERVTVTMPGAVSFEFYPEAGAAERTRAVEQARACLAELLRDAGVDGVDAARDGRERRTEMQAARRRADETLRDLLDGDDRADLIERREALQERMTRRGMNPDPVRPRVRSRGGCEAKSSRRGTRSGVPGAAGRPGVDGAAPGSTGSAGVAPAALFEVAFGPGAVGGAGGPAGADPPGGPAVTSEAAITRVERAREAEELARVEATRVLVRLEAVRTDVDRLRLESARAESLLQGVRRESGEQRARLEALRAGRSDAGLEADAAGARSAAAAADSVVAARTNEMRRHDVEGVRDRFAGVRAELPIHERRRREVEDERIRVEARLEHVGEQGRNEAFDAAVSEREHARRVHDGHHRHAEAARLLHSTLQEQSHAAKQAYVRPFTEAIARFGRIVYGPDFEVEVDDDLRIEARVLSGRRIPYAALSSGAKEQLAIITRLACATLVDAERGVPVVIDDALGYSDPDKLRRVCAAFGRLGTEAQVLLLTCTPGRYAAITDAEVVRL